MKTSELIGPSLDWAVLTAKGFTFNGKHWTDNKGHYHLHDDSPSTNWILGGPIIERERIQLRPERGMAWRALRGLLGPDMSGPTPLIATMRCFIAAKLGDEVDVPENLC